MRPRHWARRDVGSISAHSLGRRSAPPGERRRANEGARTPGGAPHAVCPGCLTGMQARILAECGGADRPYIRHGRHRAGSAGRRRANVLRRKRRSPRCGGHRRWTTWRRPPCLASPRAPNITGCLHVDGGVIRLKSTHDRSAVRLHRPPHDPVVVHARGSEGHVAVPVPAYLVVHRRACSCSTAGSTSLQFDRSPTGEARLPTGSTFTRREIARWLRSTWTLRPSAGRQLASPLRSRRRQRPAAGPTCCAAPWWEAAHKTGRAPRLCHHRVRHGPTGAPVDGEHDVFGDGSVVCVPTHGHTPGTIRPGSVRRR
jgi:hypothetical protein